MPRFFKNLPKKHKSMEENSVPQEVTTEEVTQNTPDTISVVVDQDGIFLRVAKNGVELAQDVGFELYQEEVEKEASEPVGVVEEEKKNEEAPVAQVSPESGTPCSDCNGTGLLNSATMCAKCNGSGTVI